MPTFRSDAFRDLAKAAGDTTLDQIAARTGLTKGHLSYLLRGKRQPNLDTAAQMVDAYGGDLNHYVVRKAA